MKIIPDKQNAVKSGTLNKREFVVRASANSKRKFNVKAARVGKTKMVYVLQGNYGYGWDDLCEYDKDQYGECKADLKAYRENQPANYRIIERRVPNPDYKETPVEETTSVKRKYTVKASQFSKGMLSDMKYAIWVFEENTNQWELYGGSFSKRVVKGFLDNINDIDADKYYTDVIVLPFGETPNDGRPVKANSYMSANNIYTDDGYSDEDNTRFEREQFAERIVHEIEDEYSIKVSDNAWGTIMDLADDLSFGADAHKHGSTTMWVLEDTIYDIIEEDTDVVIGSTEVSAAQRLNISEWENNYEPDEYSTDPEGLGYELNKAISLVGEILNDWASRTPTKLDKSIVDEVYDIAYSEPKSCQELADEVYAILESAYPELVDSATKVSKYTVRASKEVSSETEWQPIPESIDDNGKISSWSTNVGGTYYWISRKDNGRFDVEYEFNGRILPVSPECEDVPTFDMAANEFEDWLNSASYVESSVIVASDTAISQEDVNELVLYITNDGQLYRQKTTPIIENMKRKRKNGKYNDNLAVKAWQYLADDGVRKYDKEFGSGKGSVAWLGKATREAIARELKDYYEDEITYEEQAIDSATEISCSSSVDTDEVQDIIRNAGITVYGVEKTRTHLGDEYKIILDTVDDCSAVMDALRNAGYSVKLDTIDGESVVFLFITAPDDTQSGVAYRVTFGYQSEIVYMDDETTDYGAILDACIDKLESEGKTGCFVNPDEYNEDEYVIGGNHGLALYTGGNFSIDKCEDSVTSAVATNHSDTKIYGADSQRDAEYLNALGSGVVDELNQYFGDTPIFDGDFIYEISDNAITFMTSGNGEVIFIQPLDDIEPNMDDLESDIEDLYISIYSDTMPKF